MARPLSPFVRHLGEAKHRTRQLELATGRVHDAAVAVAAGIAVDAFTPRRRLEDAFLAVGIAMENALLMGFSSVGFLSGGQMLWRWLRPMDARNWWLQEHYAAMVGNGAATHVAFDVRLPEPDAGGFAGTCRR